MSTPVILKLMPFLKKSMVDGRSTIVNKGFTLIELLVVIAILGILVTIAIASYTSAQGKSRDGRRKGDMDAVKKALELAKSDTTGGFFPGCPSNAPSCQLSNAATTNNPSIETAGYIKKTPQDPKNTGVYVYTYIPTAANCTGQTGATPCSSYTLVACLENGNDAQKDTVADTTRCPAASAPASYTVNAP